MSTANGHIDLHDLERARYRLEALERGESRLIPGDDVEARLREIANTRCISAADRSPRSRCGAQLGAADDPSRNALSAAVIAATSALVGG